jgi:alginate O-acetyltransferase complex protein AlgI
MKYANFFVHEWNRVLVALGGEGISFWHVALPIGISFVVFQKISYLVDVYRRDVRAAHSCVTFALYVSLFPQLIAGPIVRYHDIAKQLKHRVHTAGRFFDGMWRFAIGLGKKVLIADQLALIADTVFDGSPEWWTMPVAWIGVLAYSAQLYFDFSGYSDMAIGLAKLFGFELLENFNRPYIARSVTEFWRRWHISLSRFMKLYVYIPLGGNRGTAVQTYINLWVVFLLSGIWHGAAWTFLIWGAMHGAWLSFERWIGGKTSIRPPGLIQILWTYLLVVLGWVVFRSTSLSDAVELYQAMFFGTWDIPAVLRSSIWGTKEQIMLVGTYLLLFLPALPAYGIYTRLSAWYVSTQTANAAKAISIGIILCLATAVMLGMGDQPFIYFQF